MSVSSQRLELSNLVFEAVKENSVSKLHLAQLQNHPIELLFALSKCNEKGETPLVIAMKGKNLSVIDELVTWMSKKGVLKNKVCYSMSVNIINELSKHIPIMELIDYLIQYLNDEVWLEFIGKVFMEFSTWFTEKDKIIALELIGASLVLIYVKMKIFISGISFWGLAMDCHLFKSQDNETPLPKTPDVYVPSEAYSVVFGSTVEVMSVEELKLFQNEVMRSYFNEVQLPHPMRKQIQALLTIRRISLQANHGHPNCFYLQSLLRFALMNHTPRNPDSVGNGKMVINTCLLILEEITRFDQKMLLCKSSDVFFKTIRLMSTFFMNTILNKPLNSPDREELSYANLLAPTKLITTIRRYHFESKEDSVCFTSLVQRFLYVLDFISPWITNEEKQKLEDYYSNLIQNFSPERNTTVLHVAAEVWNGTENYAILLKIIQLILKLGADPNAIDEKGRTPLHILAGMKKLHLEEFLIVFKSLVNAGSHLDMATDDGETVLSILKKTLIECKIGKQMVDPYFESLINTVFPLSCYCARVIRRNGIRFDEDRLPLCLQTLVACHGAKDFTK